MEQDALESHALVRAAVGILGTAGRGKTKELGENQEVAAEGGDRIRLGLLCDLGNGIRLLLLEFRRQSLLLLCETSPRFLIDLLVLGELLLELEQLGLQRGLLQVGGLLVGIDDLGGHEVVEGPGAVLGNEGVNLGRVGLGNICQYAIDSKPAGRHVATYDLLGDVADAPAEAGQRRDKDGHLTPNLLLQVANVGIVGLLLTGSNGGSPLGGRSDGRGGLGALRLGPLLLG